MDDITTTFQPINSQSFPPADDVIGVLRATEPDPLVQQVKVPLRPGCGAVCVWKKNTRSSSVSCVRFQCDSLPQTLAEGFATQRFQKDVFERHQSNAKPNKLDPLGLAINRRRQMFSTSLSEREINAGAKVR